MYNKISNFYIQPEEEYLEDSLPIYPELDDMQRSLQRNPQRNIDDNHNLSSENLNDSIDDIVLPYLGAIPRQTQIPQRLFVEN